VRRGHRSAVSIANLRRAYKLATFEPVSDRDGKLLKDQDGKPVIRPRFPDLDLHGPHDLRHTFATWLEDGGIPNRVIDELMGHESGRRSREGSTIGPRYRHTTAEMLARVVAAIEERLATSLESRSCTAIR
jgi:integrase